MTYNKIGVKIFVLPLFNKSGDTGGRGLIQKLKPISKVFMKKKLMVKFKGGNFYTGCPGTPWNIP